MCITPHPPSPFLHYLDHPRPHSRTLFLLIVFLLHCCRSNAVKAQQQAKNAKLLKHIKKSTSVKQLKKLIEEGADVNAGSKACPHSSPLLYATTIGKKSFVKALLECKADVNQANEKHLTPMLEACNKAYLEIVKMLFYAGAKLNLSVDGADALRLAFHDNKPAERVEVIKFLLLSKADPEPVGHIPRVILACQYEGYGEAVKALVNAKANIHRTDEKGLNALNHAISRGFCRTIGALVEAKADVNKHVGDQSPLKFAMTQKNSDVVQLLIESKADPQGHNRHIEGHVEAVVPKTYRCSCGRVHEGENPDADDDEEEHVMYDPMMELVQHMMMAGPEAFNAAMHSAAHAVSVSSSKQKVEENKVSAEPNFDEDEEENALCVRPLSTRADVSVTMIFDPKAAMEAMLKACVHGREEVAYIVNWIHDENKKIFGNDEKALAKGETCITQIHSRHIYDSAADGDIESLRLLLKEGYQSDTFRDTKGRNALMIACVNEKVRCVAWLLKVKADVNCRAKDGKSALHYASRRGHTICVLQICKAGGKLTCETNNGQTPLMLAAISGKRPCVELLIKKRVNIDLADADGYTALTHAARHGNIDCVEALLTANADRTIMSKEGKNAKGIAKKYEKKEVVKLFATFDQRFKNIYDLAKSTSKDVLVQLKKMTGQGLDVDRYRDKDGRNAIMIAVIKKNIEAVKILIAAKACLKTDPKFGATPLMTAAHKGYAEMVAVLLKGSDVDAQTDDGKSSLMKAAGQGNVTCVDLLINNNATVDLCDERGFTALCYAARYGHVDCCETLLEAGAGRFFETNSGETPRDLAEQANIKNKSHILRLMDTFNAQAKAIYKQAADGVIARLEDTLSHHPNMNVDQYTDKTGGTALIVSSAKGYVDIVEVLLGARANVNHQENDGWTALMKASKNGRDDCVQVLLDAGADTSLKTHGSGRTARMIAQDEKMTDVLALIDGLSMAGKPIYDAVMEKDMETLMKLVTANQHSNANRQRLRKAKRTSTNSGTDTGITPGASPGDATTPGSDDDDADEYVEQPEQPAVDVDQFRDKDGRSALMCAVVNNEPALAEILISANADVNLLDNYGYSSIIRASSKGNAECLEVLLKANADPDSANKKGKTCLMLAVQNKRTKCVELLLKHGASTSVVDKDNKTILIKAAGMGYAPCVRILLAAGIDIDTKDKDGRNALDVAVHMKEKEVENLIRAYSVYNAVQNGVDAAAFEDLVTDVMSRDISIDQYLNSEGENAYLLAAKTGHAECLYVLLEAETFKDAQNYTGRSALMLTAQDGNLECMILLLQAGVSRDLVDNEGETALSIAMTAGYSAYADVFLQEVVKLQGGKDGQADALVKAGQEQAYNDKEALASSQLNVHASEFNGGDIVDYNVMSQSINAALDQSNQFVQQQQDPYTFMTEPQAKPDFSGFGFEDSAQNARAVEDEGAEVNATATSSNIDFDNHGAASAADASVDGAANRGEKAVFDSVRSGDTLELQRLIEEGTKVDGYVDNRGHTALILASCHGRTDSVLILLMAQADMTKRNIRGRDALMNASWHGHEGCVELLLQAGSNIEAADKFGQTSLILAALNGKTACMQMLIRLKANLEARTHEGNTGLILAAEDGKTESVKMLLKYGSNPNLRGNGGTTALIKAARWGKPECVSILLDAGAEVEAVGDDGKSALTWAQEKNKTSCVALLEGAGAQPQQQMLMKKKAGASGNVNQKANAKPKAKSQVAVQLAKSAKAKAKAPVQQQRVQPKAYAGGNKKQHAHVSALSGSIFNAAKLQNSKKLSQLLATVKNVDVMDEYKDNQGDTAVMHCAVAGKADSLLLLLEAGANLETHFDDGWTALIKAARWGQIECVKLLLKYGSNVDFQDKRGRTARAIAKSARKSRVVDLIDNFKARGCRIEVVNRNPAASAAVQSAVNKSKVKKGTSTKNARAIFEAVRKGDFNAMKRLGEGADVDHYKDEDGRTALILAAIEGRTEMVEWLLDHGAAVNFQDTDEDTALIWASNNGNSAVMQTLLNYNADVHIYDSAGDNALLAASINGQTKCVQYLLHAKADPDARDSYRGTALMNAAYAGSKEAVMVLLQGKADVRLKDKKKKNAAMVAEAEGHHEIAVMIRKFASHFQQQVAKKQNHKVMSAPLSNNKQKKGFSKQVFFAARNGNDAEVKMLINKSDFDIKVINNYKDGRGYTALKAAATGGHNGCMRLLLDAGHETEGVDKFGATALMNAAYKGHRGTVRMLLAYGADVNAKDYRNMTAVSHAKARKNNEIAKLINNYNGPYYTPACYREDSDSEKKAQKSQQKSKEKKMAKNIQIMANKKPQPNQQRPQPAFLPVAAPVPSQDNGIVKKFHESSRDECVICLDAVADMLFNCGHIRVCTQCSAGCERCPLCRVLISSRQRVDDQGRPI